MKIFILMVLFTLSLFSSSHLVNVRWVDSHLNDNNLVILDTSDNQHYFSEGHLPKAINTQLSQWREKQTFFLRVRNIDAIQKLIRSFGINNNSKVLIYSHIKKEKDLLKSTYLYWVLRYHGLNEVYILDGGLHAWKSARKKVSYKTEPSRKQGDFTSKIQKYRLIKLDEVRSLVNKASFLDSRSPAEYFGIIASEGVKRKGHIPFAKSYPSEFNLDDNFYFKPVSKIKDMLDGINVKPENETIVFCNKGLQASFNYFLLDGVLGYKKVRYYDSSMQQWENLLTTGLIKYKWE